MSFRQPETDDSWTLLASLPIVSVDTETTGLDTSTDRIIELGGVHIDNGQIDGTQRHSQLVDPGTPIPERSSKVHGIRDADVAGAPSFPEAMRGFSKFAGTRAVIGFSIGFDMGVLLAEHKRAGVRWVMPRCLDVAHLVRIVNHALPAQSLEVIAEWLGVEVRERHRALGDAELAAKSFLAILPQLRKRGIRTLAQAERACCKLGRRIDEELDAGWELVVRNPEKSRQSVSAFAKVDCFPYRHKVGDLMSAPPIRISAEKTMTEAVAVMVDNNIGSVIVDRPDGKMGGILTERDVLTCLRNGGAKRIGKSVEFALKDSLITIEKDEFVYRALLRMSENAIRHLIVVDQQGEPIGLISARNLLNQRADEAISLGDKIENSTSPEELGSIWQELVKVVQALSLEELGSANIAEIISRELRALTRRACQLAEAELERKGLGPSPVRYDLLVLGSGGRGESLLAMDQDNAIVYERDDPEGEAARWQALLGQRLADMLDSIGLAYCKGGVMASNAEWRMDLPRWRETVAGWLGRSRAQDILHCDIFFDAVHVHGKGDLAGALRGEAMEMAGRSGEFLKFLALNASDTRSPFGLMGNLKTRGGRLDLKMHGLLPIFSCARALALRHGIGKRTTPARLRAFAEIREESAQAVDALIDAHRILMTAVLRQQLEDILEGQTLGNAVEVKRLHGHEQEQLKWALGEVSNIPSLLGTPVGI